MSSANPFGISVDHDIAKFMYDVHLPRFMKIINTCQKFTHVDKHTRKYKAFIDRLRAFIYLEYIEQSHM